MPYGSAFWLYVERPTLHGVISGYAGNNSHINECTGLVELSGDAVLVGKGRERDFECLKKARWDTFLAGRASHGPSRKLTR